MFKRLGAPDRGLAGLRVSCVIVGLLVPFAGTAAAQDPFGDLGDEAPADAGTPDEAPPAENPDAGPVEPEPTEPAPEAGDGGVPPEGEVPPEEPPVEAAPAEAPAEGSGGDMVVTG